MSRQGRPLAKYLFDPSSRFRADLHDGDRVLGIRSENNVFLND